MFEVETGIFESFPGMHLAVVLAEGLDNSRAPPGLQAHWASAWRSAGALDLANAQSHPLVSVWREQLKEAGVPAKKYPTSIEAMLRRALKGGEPFSINPLVDLYNSVSLRHIVPAGAWDRDAMAETLSLRRTRAGDRFTALGESDTVEVPPGEIAYACGPVVLTRQFMWRQSAQALVGTGTRRVFLVSEVPGPGGRALAERVRDDLGDGVERFFGVATRRYLLDASHPVLPVDA